MTREVHLDPQQVVQADKIYDHTREQFGAVSFPLYEALHAKHEADRKARKKGSGGGGRK